MIQLSEPLNIRLASPNDVDTLVAFNAAMALETECRRLDLTRLRKGVEALLTAPTQGFYLVAESSKVDGHPVVGQLLITYEWSDWRNGLFWWIQSVYVVPDQRRKGIFRAMHDYILAKAKSDPRVCGLRLYVERKNDRAQTVYQHVGLSPSVYAVYEQDFVLGRPESAK